jgi:hypothetical protein
VRIGGGADYDKRTVIRFPRDKVAGGRPRECGLRLKDVLAMPGEAAAVGGGQGGKWGGVGGQAGAGFGCEAVGEDRGAVVGEVARPWSKAASQRAERSRPLWTSRRSASEAQSDQGLMWEARRRGTSLMPVRGQRPCQ